MPNLAILSIPNKNGVPKDEVKFSFAFDDSTPASQVEDWVIDLFEHNYGTFALRSYMASCLDWNSAVLREYDLTGHLDGTPHGSPVGTVTGAFSPPPAPDVSHGNQLALVVGFQSADYGTTPTVTGTGPVPTPEQAQDYGAPATHTGQLKGKARHAGRIYLGPMSFDSIVADANNNPVWGGALLVDLEAALAAQKPGGANDHGVHWSVWSRRDATLRHVTQGWIDHGVKTRRTREFVPNLRTTF